MNAISASTGGAVKAHIETLGLRVAVYRDRAPQDAALPLIVVQEGISLDALPMGDLMDPDGDQVVAELVQVSLFQPWRNPDGKPGESYTLAAALHRGLHGCLLPTAPTVVSGVTVANHVRLLQVDSPGSTADPADAANVVHDALTLRIRRSY